MSTFEGSNGTIHYERWTGPDAPTHIAVVVHGYAEYAARYAHLAERLVSEGAAVYGEDHIGHGRSEGERALITDFDHVIADIGRLVEVANR